MKSFAVAVAGAVSALLFVATSIAAMITHIVVCIKSASWLLLLAGALMPPIGVIHGIDCWRGGIYIATETAMSTRFQ